MKKLTDVKGSATLMDIMSAQGVEVKGEENITSKGNLKGMTTDEKELENNINKFMTSGRQEVFHIIVKTLLGENKRCLI